MAPNQPRPMPVSDALLNVATYLSPMAQASAEKASPNADNATHRRLRLAADRTNSPMARTTTTDATTMWSSPGPYACRLGAFLGAPDRGRSRLPVAPLGHVHGVTHLPATCPSVHCSSFEPLLRGPAPFAASARTQAAS